MTAPDPRCQPDMAQLLAVFEAAYELCMGYDWNNGTAAKHCGYRRRLLSAVNAIKAVPDFEDKYRRLHGDAPNVGRCGMTDSELIDWLETKEGWSLVSDDFGRWAVTSAGMQNFPDDIAIPSDICTSFFIEAKEWRPSIREAILAAHSPQDSSGVPHDT